jgi:hypothetical protein
MPALCSVPFRADKTEIAAAGKKKLLVFLFACWLVGWIWLLVEEGSSGGERRAAHVDGK